MKPSQTPAQAWERLTGLSVDEALVPDQSTDELIEEITAHWSEMFNAPMPEGEADLLRRYIDENRLRQIV